MNWTSSRGLAAVMLVLAVATPVEGQRRADRDRDDDREEVYDRDDDHRYGDRQGERGQKRDRDVYSRSERQDRDDDRYDRDDDDRYDRGRRSERGNGPAFCRSGEGHPVFGWEWCRERGWDRGSNTPVRWEQRRWEDVVFRRTDRQGTLDRGDLGDVLGSVIFGRLDTRRRELGSRDSYSGRWVMSNNRRELWVSAGGIPLARLVDRDGDRRVDGIYLAER